MWFKSTCVFCCIYFCRIARSCLVVVFIKWRHTVGKPKAHGGGLADFFWWTLFTVFFVLFFENVLPHTCPYMRAPTSSKVSSSFQNQRAVLFTLGGNVLDDDSSNVTPADLLMVSMATSPVSHVLLTAEQSSQINSLIFYRQGYLERLE